MKSVKSFPLKDLLKDVRSGFACGEEAPDGIFQIRMNNITREGQLDFSKKRLVPATHRAIPKSILKSGDILFNATNSPDLVGKTALFRGSEEPIVFSNHFLRLQVDDSRVFSSYLTRWLQLRYTQGKFKSMCRQWVNQATVDKDALMTLQVPLPPLDEQRRIAAVLDKVDALRAKRREAIALLDDLTQSVFLDMFGDPLSNRKGWEKKALTEICHCYSGGTPSKKDPENWGGDLPWFSPKDMKQNDLFTSQDYISDDLPSRTNLRLLPADTVAIVVRGMILAHTFPVCVLRVPSTINQDLKALLPRVEIEPQFLANCLRLQAGYVLKQISTSAHGTKRLETEGLSKIGVIIPPLSLQKKFAERVSAITSLKEAHRTHLAHLDELFASLQQRAFRGDLFSSEAA